MRTRLLVKFGKLAIGVLDGYNSDVCPSSFLPGLASWPGHNAFLSLNNKILLATRSIYTTSSRV